MIVRGGVNRLHRTTSHLAGHIREAKRDRNLMQMLAGLDEIVQNGKSLGREDEEWLAMNGISVFVSVLHTLRPTDPPKYENN
jgi:hypothetical protein